MPVLQPCMNAVMYVNGFNVDPGEFSDDDVVVAADDVVAEVVAAADVDEHLAGVRVHRHQRAVVAPDARSRTRDIQLLEDLLAQFCSSMSSGRDHLEAVLVQRALAEALLDLLGDGAEHEVRRVDVEAACWNSTGTASASVRLRRR